ncbi:MAG: ankyrin repeat domain-containing protein [Bacteroidota bacterium]
MKAYQSLAVLLILLLSSKVSGQENMLLNRSFWKQQPSVVEIEKKIEEGHSPTEMTAFNFDATVYALLENNSLETIKYLLNQGNPIDKITHDGRTYLMWAAYKGNLEVMKYLVSQGAKTDVIDQHGYSLFMFPASTGQSNKEMYDYLINNLGIDIHKEKDRKGRNALVAYAARLKNFEMVDYFIAKGLDIYSVDADGNGVFHYAAQTGNQEVMKKLASTYKVNTSANEKTNENAILFATRRFSRSGDETDLSFYVFLEETYNLDPAIVSVKGNNVLLNLASRTKKPETLTYFVEKGVDANQVDEKGNNPLINASARGSEETISYLVSQTSNINSTNKEGISSLTRAIKFNTLGISKMLVNYGADATLVDQKGNSLAHHLVDAYNGDINLFKEKMEYLVELGVDVKAKQESGATLVHNAIKKNDVELLKELFRMTIAP